MIQSINGIAIVSVWLFLGYIGYVIYYWCTPEHFENPKPEHGPYWKQQCIFVYTILGLFTLFASLLYLIIYLKEQKRNENK